MSKSAEGADSLTITIEERADIVPKPQPYMRSARLRDPWKTINRRTSDGRAIVGMVDAWREELGGDPADTRLTADLIALGQMYLVAERARSNPLTPAASVAWAENSYWRRAKLLGLSRHHKYSAASRLVRPR